MLDCWFNLPLVNAHQLSTSNFTVNLNAKVEGVHVISDRHFQVELDSAETYFERKWIKLSLNPRYTLQD